MSRLLEVEDLQVAFATPGGEVMAVRGPSFHVDAGETVAIVGESGSGKSVTAMSLLRLLKAPAVTLSGRISFKGRDLLTLPEADMRKVRGAEISMVFQEPLSALNPVMTVGAQIGEVMRLHQGASAKEAAARAVETLRRVGIPSPERRAREYAHQLSGGMRQRVMIAMALACDPDLLIADEPTTALDVTVQAQILELIRSLQSRSGSAVILITHDLGVVAELADRVLVMYAGGLVEQGTTREIFSRPGHPYTRGLLGAMPRIGASLDPPRSAGRKPLVEIPGRPPNPREVSPGCAFAPRCQMASALCRSVWPAPVRQSSTQASACHYALAMVTA